MFFKCSLLVAILLSGLVAANEYDPLIEYSCSRTLMSVYITYLGQVTIKDRPACGWLTAGVANRWQVNLYTEQSHASGCYLDSRIEGDNIVYSIAFEFYVGSVIIVHMTWRELTCQLPVQALTALATAITPVNPVDIVTAQSFTVPELRVQFLREMPNGDFDGAYEVITSASPSQRIYILVDFQPPADLNLDYAWMAHFVQEIELANNDAFLLEPTTQQYSLAILSDGCPFGGLAGRIGTPTLYGATSTKKRRVMMSFIPFKFATGSSLFFRFHSVMCDNVNDAACQLKVCTKKPKESKPRENVVDQVGTARLQLV